MPSALIPTSANEGFELFVQNRLDCLAHSFSDALFKQGMKVGLTNNDTFGILGCRNHCILLCWLNLLGFPTQDTWLSILHKIHYTAHDKSAYANGYLSGMLRIEAKQNMATIARTTGMVEQNTQHFMSHSPWSGPGLVSDIQKVVAKHSEFQTGATLAIDKSADQKAGEYSAGAGRQHNGRMGKIEMSGVPFEAVAMDDLCGRNTVLRKRLHDACIKYYGDIPANTVVSLDKPQIVYPITKHGKPSKKYEVVAKQRFQVSELYHHRDLEWAEITLRPYERDHLRARFGRCRLWLVHQGECRQEWLLIRQDNKQITYTLSNASPTTSLQTMAQRESHRYFVERSNQDEKDELGWDEFQAVKYLAWEHQLALTILASWFIADTRLDWMQRNERNPVLLEQYNTDVLPLLSVGNVRKLLRAAMPLPQLTTQEAAVFVVKNLINRARSRKSCLRKQQDHR